ncbi:MAG: tyrosine-type recombinase/integrase, partial [Mesoflavibacter sp.]|nr:tyrosine-type recombinase/integrase [Mesoflavibacter sp.]
KGNKRRRLHLNPQIRQILSEWLAVRSFFLNSDKENAFFISKKGNRLAIRTMEDNMKKIVCRSGLETGFNITCHTLRHSFASHLNDENVDILVIQSLLGHSTPRSTEPYIHPSFDNIREAMERLPSVLFMKELVESGALQLDFQPEYRARV